MILNKQEFEEKNQNARPGVWPTNPNVLYLRWTWITYSLNAWGNVNKKSL